MFESLEICFNAFKVTEELVCQIYSWLSCSLGESWFHFPGFAEVFSVLLDYVFKLARSGPEWAD